MDQVTEVELGRLEGLAQARSYWLMQQLPNPGAPPFASHMVQADDDVLALVAEVRRLRTDRDAADRDLVRTQEALRVARAALQHMLDQGVSGALATVASKALNETGGLA